MYSPRIMRAPVFDDLRTIVHCAGISRFLLRCYGNNTRIKHYTHCFPVYIPMGVEHILLHANSSILLLSEQNYIEFSPRLKVAKL